MFSASIIGLALKRTHFRVFSQHRIRRCCKRTAAAVSYTPVQVAQLYDFPSGRGEGQCIGIIELGGGFRQRICADTSLARTSRPPQVSLSRSTALKTSPTGEPERRWRSRPRHRGRGRVAPGAKIVVYFAPNTDRVLSTRLRQPSTTRPQAIDHLDQLGGAGNHGTADASGDEPGVSGGCRARGHRLRRRRRQWRRTGAGMGSRTSTSRPQVRTRLAAAAPGCKLQVALITASRSGMIPREGATGGGVSAVFPVPAYQSSINPTSANPGLRSALVAAFRMCPLMPTRIPAIRYSSTGRHSYSVARAPSLPSTPASLLINQSVGKNVGYVNPLLYAGECRSDTSTTSPRAATATIPPAPAGTPAPVLAAPMVRH